MLAIRDPLAPLRTAYTPSALEGPDTGQGASNPLGQCQHTTRSLTGSDRRIRRHAPFRGQSGYDLLSVEKDHRESNGLCPGKSLPIPNLHCPIHASGNARVIGIMFQ